MDCKRFLADWATAEIIKQYLCSQHKMKKCKHQVPSDNDQNNEDIDNKDDDSEGVCTDDERVGVGADNVDEEQGLPPPSVAMLRWPQISR